MKIRMVRMNADDEVAQSITIRSDVRPHRGDTFYFHYNEEAIKTTVTDVVFCPGYGGDLPASIDILAYCN